MSFDSFDLTTISIIASDDTSTKGMTLEELRGLTKYHFRFMQGLILMLWLIAFAFFADPIQVTTTEKIFFTAVMVMVTVYFHYILKHEVRELDEAIERRDRDKEKKL